MSIGNRPRPGIDTSTPVGWMFFQILGAIAEFEHAVRAIRMPASGPPARAVPR
ncbi:MAG: hypothetical protein ACR2QA_12375 [Solirubrobacteraceae bacterium]